MRCLLTAFEPFDGTGLNASLEGCRLFLERWREEFDLRFAVLPVEYGPDVTAVEAALAAFPPGGPEVILHTGQATGAAEVRVERLAVNVRYGEDGKDSQQWIDPLGEIAHVSTLPVDALAAAIRAEGIPCVVSNHAGIYLCNHALYHSLRRAIAAGSRTRIGFLHVPCLPEQVDEGGRCLRGEETARSIYAALRFLRRQEPG